MSLSIVQGKIYDRRKGCFITCPYDKHELCQYSCALIQKEVSHQKAWLTFGCGCAADSQRLTDINDKEIEEED